MASPADAGSEVVQAAPATPVTWRAAALGILRRWIRRGAHGERQAAGPLGPVDHGRRGARLHRSAGPGLAAAADLAGDAAGALAAADDPPTFSVLVAARDEAAVLRSLVADVSRQDYRTRGGQPLFELVVVDDRSTDGTGDAVRAAASECGIAAVTRVIRDVARAFRTARVRP